MAEEGEEVTYGVEGSGPEPVYEDGQPGQLVRGERGLEFLCIEADAEEFKLCRRTGTFLVGQ